MGGAAACAAVRDAPAAASRGRARRGGRRRSLFGRIHHHRVCSAVARSFARRVRARGLALEEGGGSIQAPRSRLGPPPAAPTEREKARGRRRSICVSVCLAHTLSWQRPLRVADIISNRETSTLLLCNPSSVHHSPSTRRCRQTVLVDNTKRFLSSAPPPLGEPSCLQAYLYLLILNNASRPRSCGAGGSGAPDGDGELLRSW